MKYKKESARTQTFTSNIDPSAVAPKVTAEGNEYIVVWVVERQSFRSLRLDRIVSVEKIKVADEKSAIRKAKKAFSAYKRTRG